jgi:hypothetical protein
MFIVRPLVERRSGKALDGRGITHTTATFVPTFFRASHQALSAKPLAATVIPHQVLVRFTKLHSRAASRYSAVVITGLQQRYRRALREKAIERAKVEIALAGKHVSDYDEEQLEIIVKAEEDKIVEKYRNSAFVVVLLALGIT